MSDKPLLVREKEIERKHILMRAEEGVRERFPGVNRMKFKVQRGKGEGFAEFYPADEAMNPNPGTPTVEVRRMDLPPEEIQAIILGDLLHDAPRQFPKFRDLKNQFVDSGTFLK